MGLVRVPGFQDSQISKSLFTRIKGSRVIQSQDYPVACDIISAKVYNAILVGVKRGQSSTPVGIYVEVETTTGHISETYRNINSYCDILGQDVRNLGFGFHIVPDFVKGGNRKKICSRDGRSIRSIVAKVTNLQDQSFDTMETARRRWRDSVKRIPSELKRPARKKKRR
jgi:hypothetical protein